MNEDMLHEHKTDCDYKLGKMSKKQYLPFIYLHLTFHHSVHYTER